MTERRNDWSVSGAVAMGVLLIGVGVFFLGAQWLGWRIEIDAARLGWPVFVIVPGVALLLWGLLLRGEPGVGLASAGGIVTAIGLLLAYQWTTGHWASWAYAWALIPSGAGAAMLLWALLHRRGSAARAGLSTLTFGAIMFLVGFGFFEGILNIGGDRGLAPLAGQLLPIALIAAGALIIVSRLWPRSGVDGDSPPAQPADWPAEDQRSTEV